MLIIAYLLHYLIKKIDIFPVFEKSRCNYKYKSYIKVMYLLCPFCYSHKIHSNMIQHLIQLQKSAQVPLTVSISPCWNVLEQAIAPHILWSISQAVKHCYGWINNMVSFQSNAWTSAEKRNGHIKVKSSLHWRTSESPQLITNHALCILCGVRKLLFSLACLWSCVCDCFVCCFFSDLKQALERCSNGIFSDALRPWT